MKTKNVLCGGMMSFTSNLGRARHSVRAVVCPTTRSAGRGLPALPILPSLFVKGKIPLCGLAIAVVSQLGMLAGSAQTNIYLYSGSKTNITLPPGTYIITAYGAPGGGYYGGLGAEMSGEFTFSTSTCLTLLMGGGGSPCTFGGSTFNGGGGGGGGGSFVFEASAPLVIAGGGGGGGGGGGWWGGGDIGVGGSGGTGPLGGDVGFYGGGRGGGYGGGGGGGGNGFSGGGGGGGYFGNGGGGSGSGGDGGYSFENGGYGGIGYGGGGDGGYGGGGGGGLVLGPYSNDGGGGYGDYSSGYGGGGGGSIIDSSAIAKLAEVSGIYSPDDYYNGEIIFTAVPTPLLISTHAAFGFTNGVFGFNVIGPAGSNVVIQASTDLQTWIPLQTNLLGSGPLYFSDAQSTTNTRRFYRLQLSP